MDQFQDSLFKPDGSQFTLETLPIWVPPTTRPSKDMPDLDDVLAITAQWAVERIDTIREIYWQRGGWERWAQVELALLFTQQYPATNTTREQLVYVGSTRRADLTLELKGEETQVIEMKMESLWQDSSSGGPANFVNALKNDIYKIDVNNLLPKYRPALVYALGITLMDPVNRFALNPENWAPYQNDIKFRLLIPSTPDSPALILWYVVLSRPATPTGDQDQHTMGYPKNAEPLPES